MTEGVTLFGNKLSRGSELAISVVVDIIGWGSTVLLAATVGTTLLVDVLFAVVTAAWIAAMFFADGEDPLDFVFGAGLGTTAILENFILIDLLPVATIAWLVKWSQAKDKVKKRGQARRN